MRLTVTRLATVAAFLFLAAPLAAEAQAPARISRVGYVSFGAEQSPFDEAFRRRLRELGYVEGQNVAIEYRFAAGRADRLDEVVAELVQRKVDVIITAGEVAVRAAKRATNKIPIIMAASPDPVGTGLVANLARPGGNITGLTTLSTELSAKRLELLKEVVPQLARVAVLTYEVDRGTASFVRELEAPALRLRVQLHPLTVRGPHDFETAFSTMTRDRVGGLVMPNHPIFTEHRRQIVDLVAKHRLPTVHAQKEFVDVGGLMSYGPSIPDLFRRAADYLDKILKGANPADLPVEQPTKFEFVINLRTAKALGANIRPSLLLRADEVIQ